MMTEQRRTKLLVVSHAMVQEMNRSRWLRLSESYPFSVRLVVPAHWSSTWFGERTDWCPVPVQMPFFEVRPVPVTDTFRWGRYFLKSSTMAVQGFSPDVVLVYGEEFSFILHQMMFVHHRLFPRAKLGFFTWNNLGIVCGRRRWLKHWLWRRTCRGTDFAVTGNSEGRRLLEDAGYPHHLITEPEIGVDETRFIPDHTRREAVRRELGLQGVVVGFVGRFTEAKGIIDLIDALAGCEPGIQVLLAGDGDLRDVLMARTSAAGLRVHFTGNVSPEHMPDILRAMDCLVLPSRTTASWKEQFGLVLTEAMACGIPVVGSDSGAIPEVIGDAGIVFPEGDVMALRAALQQLVTSEPLRARLGQAGRERCLSKYSAKGLAGHLAGWMKEVVGA